MEALAFRAKSHKWFTRHVPMRVHIGFDQQREATNYTGVSIGTATVLRRDGIAEKYGKRVGVWLIACACGRLIRRSVTHIINFKKNNSSMYCIGCRAVSRAKIIGHPGK